MNKRQFHNALRILLNIDRWDVEWMTKAQWAEFIDNPHRFFIRTDDPTADRLWAMIEERNRPRAHERAESDRAERQGPLNEYLAAKGERA